MVCTIKSSVLIPAVLNILDVRKEYWHKKDELEDAGLSLGVLQLSARIVRHRYTEVPSLPVKSFQA